MYSFTKYSTIRDTMPSPHTQTSTYKNIFTDLLELTKFNCSCGHYQNSDTKKQGHTIRILDPHITDDSIATALSEAALSIAEKRYCKGPWKTQIWAITDPEQPYYSDTIQVTPVANPTFYPDFFDLAVIKEENTQNTLEQLQQIAPTVTGRGIIAVLLHTKPSHKLLQGAAEQFSQWDVYSYEGKWILFGHKAVNKSAVSIHERRFIDTVIDTIDHRSIIVVQAYKFRADIGTKEISTFRNNINPITTDDFDPSSIPAHLTLESAWTNNQLVDEIFDNISYNTLHPIEPLLAGHLGLLLPVGYLNNRIIHDKEAGKDPIVIKGSVEKFEEVISEEDGKIITEENFEIRVTSMNLRTGEIHYIGEEDDISLTDFLKENETALYNSTKKVFPPSVDYTSAKTQSYIEKLKTLKRYPVGKQGATIISLASHLSKNKNAFCIGQQGSGKTYMALGVLTALQYNKVIIMCPTHAVETWRREIKETIKDAVVLKPSGISGTTHSKTQIPLDKIAELECSKPTFILLPKDISKLGFTEKLTPRKSTLIRNTWGKARTIKYRKPNAALECCPACKGEVELVTGTDVSPNTYKCKNCTYPNVEYLTCPTCWSPIQWLHKRIDKEFDKLYSKLTEEEYEAISQKELIDQATENVLSKIKTRHYCEERVAVPEHDMDKTSNGAKFKKCGAVLTHPDTDIDARFHHRIAYGEYIAKYLTWWPDLFIIDELHQYKGKNSLQTAVAGRIAQKVKKTLGLTGTLMGGYASNLYWLMEHFIPSFPEEIPWNSETSFIEQFGKFRHTYKMNRKQFDRMMAGLTRKQVGTRTEIPGYHPELLKFILPTSVFVRIYDINRELAAPNIEAQIIPLDTENTAAKKDSSINQQSAYNKLRDAMELNAIERVQRGENYNLLALMHELMTYPENCWQGSSPVDTSVRPEKTIITIPPVVPKKEEGLYPKEDALVKIIHKEVVKLKRKCLIYCTHTNEKATWTRIEKLLNSHKELPNVKCAFMNSKGSAETRLDRLEKLADKNDVVIIQPQAVETGINLQQFPTIIWYEPHLSIYTTEQASARSHRINQTEEVKIYYLAYAGTYQERQLKLLANKRDVSSTITGIINDDSLSNLNAKQLNLREILAKELHDGYRFTDDSSIDERAEEITKLFNQQRTQLEEQIKADNKVLLDTDQLTAFNSTFDIKEQVEKDINSIKQIDLIESALPEPEETYITEEPVNDTCEFTAYDKLLQTAGKQHTLFA